MSQSGVRVRGIIGGLWQGACWTGAAIGRGVSLLWQVTRRLLFSDRSRPVGAGVAARQARREERRRRKQLRREAERARAAGRSSLRKAA